MVWNRTHFNDPKAALTVEEIVTQSGLLIEIKSRCCVDLEINTLLQSAISKNYFIILSFEVSHKIQPIFYKGGTGLVYLKSLKQVDLIAGDVLLLPDKDPKQIRPNSYW